MNERIKSMLMDLRACRIDFSVTFSDQNVRFSSSGLKLGDYTDNTRQIRIFATRINSVRQILETAIHEYAHHLMNETPIFHESGRVVHGKKFWECYRQLMDTARQKGIFSNDKTCRPDERIQHIADKWFIKEPLLLMAMLSHEMKPALHIDSIRSGKGMIEYNPHYVSFLSAEQFEERLKAEVIRILLRHPYRLQVGSNKGKAYIASNITVNEYYPFKYLLYNASDYWGKNSVFQNKHYEFYYREIMKMTLPSADDGMEAESMAGNSASNENTPSSGNSENNESGGESGGDPTINYSEITENAALWDDDAYFDRKITEIIQFAQQSMSWGDLPANLIQTLEASLHPKIDYRKVLNGFRATILSSERTLSRFKPSRRYGFQYMGKKSSFTTRLLVAIDVSGSISDIEIRLFYSVVNRFFKYGIQSIDVIQFDVEIKGAPTSMKKAQKSIKVQGRGGTDFQPAVDYFSTSRKVYDGMIIFTDGYASVPNVPPSKARKMLWICSNQDSYERHHEWMRKIGRCCWIEEK